MTFNEFNEFQKKLITECIDMQKTKGAEYAHSEDRFANFNRLSEGLNLSNITIGWVYCKKHIEAIESYVKCGSTRSLESIRGRFIDTIVYLTLIAGMIEERDVNQMATKTERNPSGLDSRA